MGDIVTHREDPNVMCALCVPYSSAHVVSFVLANQEGKTIPRGLLVLILNKVVISWIHSTF